ncbi:MAG: valine--tRNA ligase [Nitrospirae bacterium]|nr:valine--tRNA ligase [Nitrospirota bacterium]
MGKTYEPHQVEDKWYPRWERAGHFSAGPDARGQAYTIVIPPPNVTGSLHMGHALNNTLQDILTRWRRMKGDTTLWLPGCDHAGIATQNVVEKQLMAEGKGRHDLGREAFVERVWQWKAESGGTIMHQLRRMGASCDWSRERFTMDEGLSRAVREVFVSLYEQGLIYRGDYIVNWCPRCESALSDLEVEHVDTEGALYHLRYQVADGGGELIIATTRPETLLGDTAVAVHPDDARYKHLIGREVELPILGRFIPIIADEYVDMKFGTGALKVTPGHDPNDFELGRRHNLPVVSVMDTKGIMNAEAGRRYEGMDRRLCRTKIVENLQAAGLLVKVEPHHHAVGHCYRCKTVVEPMVSTQWFVKIQPLAGPAIQAVRDGRVRFHPDSWKNTYFEWMENIRDWCISRQIWWGHRIPAWHCPCGHTTVSRTDVSACEACGGTDIHQETDVLDTWFSSALWPFSTLGWPDHTEDLRRHYPTNTLVTGFDILFFWVARMIMMGVKFMGDVPFRDVYVHALVRDSQGQKMSKSKGNVIDPLTVIDQYGTDAFRFTLAAMASPGRDIRLAEDRIAGYRNFANKIWNAARFIEMNLPEGQPPTLDLAAAVSGGGIPERWIAGRLEQTAAEVNRQLADFRFDEAARVLYNFVWGEFCDWYLELSKPALNGDDEAIKGTTRAVLVGVFDGILRLLHPFMPFITEEIRSLLPNTGGTIMTAPFPEGNPALVDADANAVIAGLMEIIGGVRNIRGTMNIPPSTELAAVVRTASAESARQVLAGAPYLARLAKVTTLTAGPDATRPAASATAVWSGGEVYVPLAGRIDVAAETARLSAQLAKVDKELDGISRKLQNPDFVERAPAEVVDKERERRAELAEREAKLKESLAFLRDLR